MQEPVTFEDIAVYLSRAEWVSMEVEQQELYRSVMLDTYQLLMSLGYPGPKPDIVYRIERGEEPWVCTPQSPVRWDGPQSPSAGHNVSCLEKTPSGWLPGVGRHHVPEEIAQIPCDEGQSLSWRLRLSHLLRKFRCLEGRREPVESPDQAPTVFHSGKEGEAEDQQGVVANVALSRGLQPHLVEEQQDKEADSQEKCQSNQCTEGEETFPLGNGEVSVEELTEAVLEDHSYCEVSEMQLLSSIPPPLREHDYCKKLQASLCGPGDHQYCHLLPTRYPARFKRVLCCPGKAQARCRWQAKRKTYIWHVVRRDRRSLWLCQPFAFKKLALSQCSSATACPDAIIPPAEAKEPPMKGQCGAFCPPTESKAVFPQPQHEEGSQEVTPEALCAPAVGCEASSNAAAEVFDHQEVQRTQLFRELSRKGQEFVISSCVSLCNTYKSTLREAGSTWGSEHQHFESGICSQMKDLRAMAHQIDR